MKHIILIDMMYMSKTRTTNYSVEDEIGKGYLVCKKVIGKPVF